MLLSFSNFSDLSIAYDSRSQSNQVNGGTENNQRMELVANPLYVVFCNIPNDLVKISGRNDIKQSAHIQRNL